MSDREPRNPRHIRIGKDDGDDRASLVFQDRIHLQKVGRSTPLLLVLAIVIVLGGVVGSSYLRGMGEAEATPPPPVEAAFGPLAPSGEATSPVVFTWSPDRGAEGYELRLEDGGGRTVWTARLGRDTRVALPGDVAGTLEPGGAYVWTVDALLPGGSSKSSRSLAFVMR